MQRGRRPVFDFVSSQDYIFGEEFNLYFCYLLYFSVTTCLAQFITDLYLLSSFFLQSLAELTFDMVSSGPSHVSSRPSATQATHPAELREGFANAYTVLTEVSGENRKKASVCVDDTF